MSSITIQSHKEALCSKEKGKMEELQKESDGSRRHQRGDTSTAMRNSSITQG